MKFLISPAICLRAESIKKTADMLKKVETTAFFDRMLTAKRVYVAGAGRSGIIARAFALRLLHLGYDVYVVGETITPALKPGDTLVVFSGSGETHSIVSICETVKELGGSVCLITASSDSRMSRIADCVVNLGDLTGYYHADHSTYEVRHVTGQYRSRAGGTDSSIMEFVLKNNTLYSIRFTSAGAQNQVLIRLIWYEDLGV